MTGEGTVVETTNPPNAPAKVEWTPEQVQGLIGTMAAAWKQVQQEPMRLADMADKRRARTLIGIGLPLVLGLLGVASFAIWSGQPDLAESLIQQAIAFGGGAAAGFALKSPTQ